MGFEKFFGFGKKEPNISPERMEKILNEPALPKNPVRQSVVGRPVSSETMATVAELSPEDVDRLKMLEQRRDILRARQAEPGWKDLDREARQEDQRILAALEEQIRSLTEHRRAA